MWKRIIFDLALFFLGIVYPGFFFFFCGIAGIIIFENYFEFLLASLIVDELYGYPLPYLYGTRFAFFIASLIVFLPVSAIKDRMRNF